MRKPSWLEYKKILKRESSFGDMSRLKFQKTSGITYSSSVLPIFF